MLYSAFIFNDPNFCASSYAYLSYIGLVSFWVGREKNDKTWIARGIECKNEIEKLAASVSIWNFQNSEWPSSPRCYLIRIISMI